MKKPILLLIAFTVFFLSCRKFEDGGKVRHCESTIARAWMLEGYWVNGNDSTYAKMNVGFDSTLITFFKGENNKLRYARNRNGYNVGPIRNPSLTGNWNGQCAYRCFEELWGIDNHDRTLQFLKYGSFFYSWQVIHAVNYPAWVNFSLGPNDMTEIKISKLTEDQLWLDDNFKGTHYVIHFKAFK